MISFHPSINPVDAALQVLVHLLETSWDQGECVLLFLSGGSAVRLYNPLAEWLSRTSVPSKQFHIAQVDERFRPTDPKDVNMWHIEQTGLVYVCQKKGIGIDSISQEGTLESSSFQYNQVIDSLIHTHTKIVAVLGIGEDGHTAGLLPHYQHSWDTNNYIVGYSNAGLHAFRISLTPKALQKVDFGMVLCSGSGKKGVLKKLKDHSLTDINQFPAGILHQLVGVCIFCDQ